MGRRPFTRLRAAARRPALAGLALGAALLWPAADGPLRAQETCRAPAPVCGAAAAVFRIGAFERFASAVRVSADELVTTRRAVADRARVTIYLNGGKTIEGRVVASGFAGDLALIRAPLPAGPALAVAPEMSGPLRVVGLDRATRSIEVFQPGGAILPVHSAAVGARLHHGAPAPPGSGGAVVDGEGRLVAVQVISRGRRSEAVPARHIARLRALSGPGHAAESKARGEAYRTCIAITGKAIRVGDVVPSGIAKKMVAACLASGSPDLIEGAGLVLSRSRMQAKAAAAFARALEIDANAIDAHIGRVMVLAIQRRHREALSDVKWLLDAAPGDPAIQRIALQTAKAAGDRGVIDRTLALIALHNPTSLEAAKRFVGTADAPLPRL